MPRLTRQYEDTDASRELAAIVSEYDKTERRLAELGTKLKEALVAVVKEDKLPIAEIARRVGYSREYVSRIATEAGAKRERPPKKTSGA